MTEYVNRASGFMASKDVVMIWWHVGIMLSVLMMVWHLCEIRRCNRV